MMAVLIFLFIVFGVSTKTNGLPNQDVDYSCTTPDQDDVNMNGFCVSIFECPEINKVIYEFGVEASNFVRSSICANFVNNLFVCCKAPRRFGVKSTTSTYFDLSNILIFQTTPVPIEPKITHATAIPVAQNDILIIQTTTAAPKSKTTAATTMPVVTTLETTTTVTEATGSSPDAVIVTLSDTTESDEPTPKISTNSNKINGLNKLARNFEYCIPYLSNNVVEYPWLVQIKSGDNQSSKYIQACNGVIIEKKYILTTSQCGYQAKSIILGEVNTSDSGATAELSVEEIFRSGEMDIGEIAVALLKLNETIIYNDYVKPLCLPLNRTSTEKEFTGFVLSDDGLTSTVCYNNVKRSEEKISEENINMLCLSPNKNSSNGCALDLGGPLTYTNEFDQKWYFDGLITNIVSDENCLNTNASGIYLTPSLIDFIVDNII